jgi:PAS domain S-box-containing protein
MTGAEFAAAAGGTRSGRPGRTEWFIAIVGAALAVALSLWLLVPMGPPDTDHMLPWPVFVGAIVLAELADVRLIIRKIPVSVRLAEIPIALGLFYLAPIDLVLAATLGMGLAELVRRDKPAGRAAAGLAMHALGCVGAVLVFHAVGDQLPDGLGADFASAIAGVAVTVVAFALADTLFRPTGEPGFGDLGRVIILGLATASVNTSLALVAMSDSIHEPGELLLLMVPVFAGLMGYRAFSAEQHRQARLRFMYDSARLLDAPIPGDAVLGELMARTRTMFAVRHAELLIGWRRAEATRVSVDGPHGAPTVATVSAEVLANRRSLLGPDHTARIVARGDAALPESWDRAIVVPLRRGQDVVGTVIVASPLDMARPFRDEDLQLLETIGARLALVVQNSELIVRLTATLDDVSKLAAIVQSSDEGIISLDAKGNVTSWNPGAERLLRNTADEILGQSASMFAAERDVECLRQRFESALAGVQLGEIQVELIRGDAGTVPVSLTLSPIWSAAGAVVGASAILRDASDRVRAEQAAVAGAAQLRTVIEASPLGMGTCGPDHRWTEANPALGQLLGMAPASLIGQPVTEMVHPDDIATVSAIEEGLFESGPVLRTGERRYVSRDGRIVWARVSARLIPDTPSGRPTALFTVDDITERRRAEDEVRSTEDQFRRATLAISGMQDPARIARATLIAARETMHAEAAAIVTAPVTPTEALDVEAQGIDPDVVRRLLVAWPAGTGSLALARRLGRPLRIHDVRSHPEFGAVLDDAPDLRSLIAVPLTHDLPGLATLIVLNRLGADEFSPGDEAIGVALATHAAVCLENARANERARQLVAQLDQTNLELTRANEAKSRFLGSVAHELRTPLHAILVAGELVHDPPGGSLRDEEIRRLGRTIESSSRHMVRLIDDLVDLARIEAGRVDLQLVQVDAGEVLGEIAASLRPTAADRGVTLDLPEAPGPSFVADPVRLRQILTNLIANAIKFTESGGRVWAEARATRTSVRITVRDTGAGIAPEDLERIFEPFEQATRTSQLGAGLGLAIARSLTELHGGKLEVQSTPSVGSAFSLVLPRLPASWSRGTVAEPVRSEAPIRGRGRLVLVVEDDPTALDLVAEVLRRADYQVHQAADLDEATRLLGHRRPDLVLLDVRLGDQSGLELLPVVRSTDPGRIPVLAISAETSPEDVRRALDAGCDAFLPKPVGPRLLLARIGSMIDDADVVSAGR